MFVAVGIEAAVAVFNFHALFVGGIASCATFGAAVAFVVCFGFAGGGASCGTVTFFVESGIDDVVSAFRNIDRRLFGIVAVIDFLADAGSREAVPALFGFAVLGAAAGSVGVVGIAVFGDKDFFAYDILACENAVTAVWGALAFCGASVTVGNCTVKASLVTGFSVLIIPFAIAAVRREFALIGAVTVVVGVEAIVLGQFAGVAVFTGFNDVVSAFDAITFLCIDKNDTGPAVFELAICIASIVAVCIAVVASFIVSDFAVAALGCLRRIGIIDLFRLTICGASVSIDGIAVIAVFAFFWSAVAADGIIDKGCSFAVCGASVVIDSVAVIASFAFFLDAVSANGVTRILCLIFRLAVCGTAVTVNIVSVVADFIEVDCAVAAYSKCEAV